MTVWPLSDPWETLGETSETGLEALPLASDSSDPWESREETERETDFFDPDLLDLYRQLRNESLAIVSEEEKFLDIPADQVSGDLPPIPSFASVIPVVQVRETPPTIYPIDFRKCLLDRGYTQVRSRSFQVIDSVNLIAARQLLLSCQVPPPKIQGIRQGDLLIMPLTERIAHWFDHEITLPFWRDPTFQKCPDLVLATGQSTGHQHRISQGKADLYQRQGTHYLRVLSAQVVLTHPEHQAVSIPQGLWAVRRQREYDSFAGWEQLVKD